MKPTINANMSSNLVTANWKESLKDAYIRMRKSGIRHLPVLDENESVVGIISDRDFQRAMNTRFEGYGDVTVSHSDFPAEATVGDFMSWPVKHVHEGDDLRSVTLRMIEEKVSAFLVVRGDHLVGIITTEDMLKVLAQLLETPSEGIRLTLPDLAYNSPIGRIAEALGNAGI